MTKLFLLKPDFTDSKIDNSGQKYYCPQCAIIEGIISCYPNILDNVEVYHVEFPRPRKSIIELIGEQNQSCPVLIIDPKDGCDVDTSYFKSFGDFRFADTVESIEKYLAEKFEIGLPHP